MPARKPAKKKAAKSSKPATKRPAKTSAKRATQSPDGRRAASKRDPLARVREICLALPEAHEVEAWGEPTFRVRNKLFAMHASASTHHGAGREAIWICATPVTQDMILRAKPDRYFSPPYVGSGGWIGAWIDRNPLWSEITELLRDAFRLKAPKRIAAKLDDD
jgi:hypothetical protein